MGDQTITKTNKLEPKVTPESPSAPVVNKLDEAIEIARRADGFMVLITRLNGDKLTHTQFTNNFRRGDIMPSLDELAKLLEPEVQNA